MISGLAVRASAETVRVYFDAAIPQINFAASDIKTALEAKNHTVQNHPLTALTNDNLGRKIVLATTADAAVVGSLAAQGAASLPSLGEQAYALRTTTNSYANFWVIGGDATGAMYGGLQIAESVAVNDLSGTYNSDEKPYLRDRGMKLNLPLDRRIPTYVGGWSSHSARAAIGDVWDMNYWTELIDQQARNRYNFLSVWVHHPFPALVSVPDYPSASLPNIEKYDGSVINLNHSQRVTFWRNVMQYAHSRGMKFYFFNWNIYVDHAKTHYPALTNSPTNPTTIDYMYKSMKALIETYPELDGFGITSGDGMDGTREENTQWTWDAMGKAVYDYLAANPARQFNLIHRGVKTDPETCDAIYAPIKTLPNATFNMSAKYAMAHMYSTPTPRWGNDIDSCFNLGLKTYITIRNDDYFYLNWGDPQFVRDFMTGIPRVDTTVEGMYIGIDGYNPSRARLFKNSAFNGQLEVTRRWYMEMLWGRLSYNKDTSDQTLKDLLMRRYGLAATPNTDFFNAWTLASRSLPKVTELVMKSWSLDFHWYPEACWSDPGRGTGFRTISDAPGATGGFAGQDVANGSNLANIAESAAGTNGTKKSSYQVATEMEVDATNALAAINNVPSGGSADVEVAIDNIKQLAYLSRYYAHKIRGATYNKAGNTVLAREEMGKAYAWWVTYSREMDAMYLGDSFRNIQVLPDWRFADQAALKEYTDLGGVGIPVVDGFATLTVNGSNGTVTTVPSGGIYPPATQVNLTASPNFGYAFSNWSGDLVGTAGQTILTMDTTKNITANFVPSQGDVAPWIETFSQNNGTKSHGSPTSWQAVRAAGTFEVNGNRLMMNGGSGATSVEGVFETAEISIPSGTVKASLQVEAAGGADSGDYVRFYKIVDGGTKVLIGQQAGNVSGVNTLLGTGISGNHVKLRIEAKVTASDEFFYIDNIKLEYEAQPTTYSLGTSTANGIIVVSPPGGVYTENTMVEVTAVPNLGYAFGSWGGDLSGSANPTTITMNGNKNVTASFNPGTTYSLVTNATNGSVSLNPPGGVYSPGTQVTLTPNPANGYTFGSWSGDLNGSASPVVITMNGNRTVTANFTELPQVGQNVLLVHGQTTLNASDEAIRARLVSLGHTVTTIDQNTAVTGDANGKGLVVISSTVSAGTINTKFRDVMVPVINWETALQDDFGFTTQANQGTSGTHSSLTIENANHPLAAGLAAGTQTIVNTPGTFAFGIPGGNPIIIARINGSSSQACIYAYEKDAPMEVGTAPARRVNLFLQNDTYVTLNANGLALFDAAVTWAIGPGTPVSYPLTTTASHGSISLNPPGGLYESGTTVGVSVTPSLGYRFVGWSGDLTGSSTSTSITMNSAKSIGADFIRVHTLASTATNGSIVLDPPGGTYDEGSTVTATAVPAQGFRFTQWSGLPQGEGATTTITMSDDVSISPIFELIIPSLVCQWDDPDVIIKWPLESSPAWRLEWTEELDSPSTWTELVAPYQSDATDWFWKGPRAGDKHFFRLRHP